MKSLFQAIDNQDADSFAAFLAENATFRFGNAPAVHGREAIKAAVSGFFDSISAISHTLNEAWQTPAGAVSHGAVTYTRLDNSTLTVPFCNVFKIRDNLIEEYLIFVDNSELYR
ncbi:nuclear transport factor 2 family protein [Alteromonas lipolytica]|uniref:SnoaL-like domain-containing protein n=1 Tax=Alteromonas lipolytica TaxID=1856405 RepID=A0A1E8FFE9_9ALTE|nr:nuclear transport factor 2 family protein [Alteromonas lipolytica]OFI34651.1 hypothetical protein BFC17_13765 [Alteromonas lipolytica]GGF52902.1 hypothetical protein GCM10011338_01260 [Alteromonas lipolytica]